MSRVVAAVCSLATLAFAGRGLGVILFGTLILITSYTKAASGIAKFQSWQLVVRYGGHGVANDNPEDFKTATGFAFALDALSGIGGMIIAVLLLPFIAAWVGIERQYLWLAMLYCTLLPTMGAATPNGVLRVLDRFDLISWAGTANPIARAILAGIAFAADAPLYTYVVIWYLTDLGGDLYTWYLGWRELRRHGLLTGISPTLRPTRSPARGSSRSTSIWRRACKPSGGRSPGSSSAACSVPRARPCSASPRASPTVPRSPPIFSAALSILRSCGWTFLRRNRGS